MVYCTQLLRGVRYRLRATLTYKAVYQVPSPLGKRFVVIEVVMAIIRKHHVGNYTVVDNGFIRDVALSLKAKGIMLVLLSLPDDWVFTEPWLVSQCSDGITAVRAALGELESHRYLERERVRDENGKLGDSIYNIYEEPNSQKPNLENPNLENHTLLSTNNTDIINKYISTNNTNSEVSEIVSYLNEKAGKNYKASSRRTAELIRARMREGFTVSDFKRVIDNKVSDWKPRKEMEQYLRPETLFGTKFEGYLNENRSGTRQVKRLGDRS